MRLPVIEGLDQRRLLFPLVDDWKEKALEQKDRERDPSDRTSESSIILS